MNNDNNDITVITPQESPPKLIDKINLINKALDEAQKRRVLDLLNKSQYLAMLLANNTLTRGQWRWLAGSIISEQQLLDIIKVLSLESNSDNLVTFIDYVKQFPIIRHWLPQDMYNIGTLP